MKPKAKQPSSLHSIGVIPLPGAKPLTIGAHHPSQAGVLQLELSFNNRSISAVRIQPGWLHRGAEKLFEVRDWRSVMMLADRHDWLSSASGELVLTLAIEESMGLVPPSRATWLRTLFAELARMHSHLSYLSHLTANVWSAVASLRELLVSCSGNRVHPMLCRVGGMANDVSSKWMTQLQDVLVISENAAKDSAKELAKLDSRLCGLAEVKIAEIKGYGLSGPVARAAGMDLDLRNAGALAWGEVFEPVAVRTAGDAAARFEILIDEVSASATMARRLAEGLPEGPVATRLARRLKVPEGEHVAELEAPWGVTSVLLVSRGGPTPWRVALRTPTFHNVAALEKLLLGLEMHQVPDAIASMGYAIGDLDK